MAETIGRVDFLVGLDGSRLPAEARALGKSIGKEGGEAGDKFGEEFEAAAGPHISKFARRISQQLSDEGKLAGSKLANNFSTIARQRIEAQKFDVANALFDQHGFDDLVLRFGDIDEAVDHLRSTLSRLNQENLFDDEGTWRGVVVTKREMAELNDVIDEFAGNLRGRVVPASKEAGESIDKLDQKLGKHASTWKRLSANTRQWTLIIGAVMAGMEGLAGLGSAAGSGLFVLAGAFSALATAAGLTVFAFVRFLGDIDKVPAEIRPARAAIDKLGDTFSDLVDAMAIKAFKDTEKSWEALTESAKEMRPAFEKVGDVINGLVKDLATNLKPGTKNLQNLNKFVEISGDVFGQLVRAVGRLGAALLDAFASPEFQRVLGKFLGYIDTLIDRFATFLAGDGFDEWLRHGEAVFGAFSSLLDTTARMLNNLVTDESIDRLVTMMGHLENFIAGPGEDLLQILGELDVFGLIAEALDEFGTALEPLAEPMKKFAAAVNDVVQAGIDIIAPILEDIAEALAPLVDELADFMAANPEAFAAALLAIGGAVAIFKVGKLVSIVASLTTFTKIKGLAKSAALIAGLALAIEGLGAVLDENQDLDAGLGALSGALIGLRFGPIGALVGTLTGLIVSMIDDVFLSPETKGAWVKGWEQLFDPNNYTGAGVGPLKQWFQNELMGPDPAIPESGGGWLDQVVTNWGLTLEGFKTGVPAFFEGLGQAFADGWASLTGWFDTNFGQPIQHAWEEFINFFTVEVPGFFARAGAWFAAGWAGLSLWFDTTFVQPVKAAWAGFINFWTVSVPSFFASLAMQFRNGLANLTAPFQSFFADVNRNWNNFWSGLGNIVSTVWNNITSTIRGAVNTAVGVINGFISAINRALGKISEITGGLVNLKIPSLPKAASGGIAAKATLGIWGEAGPEALVPLNRPLSQVDPSVRALSAFAQGMTVPQGTTGGSSGVASRVINVAEGAIQVIGSLDPRRTAVETVNRLVQRAVY